MKTRRKVKQSVVPLPAEDENSRNAAGNIDQPASNATRQLEKPQVRRKAQSDQSILLEKGPNALPVSDYPLKVGPLAANSVDCRERSKR